MEKKNPNMGRMPITPKGFRLLVCGLLVILSGYLLMMGGGSGDPQVFSPAIFDFRRLVAAPVVILAGMVVEIVALMSCRGEVNGPESEKGKAGKQKAE